ncbi:hypothetical protein [Microtetraspora malaysiensis]|uniref:hypothetical protein n=1 Tax=Microtetraspora malaysiensis TaxID=161358 RepID=UPI003D92D8B0
MNASRRTPAERSGCSTSGTFWKLGRVAHPNSIARAPYKKIGEISAISNTMSIELPYDVDTTAQVTAIHIESNNCLKMIFDRGTVALCDMKNTDWEVVW